MTTPHEAPAVAMTTLHEELVTEAFEALRKLTPTNEQPELKRRYLEILANIRSQVQGMKLYDPKLSVVIERGDAGGVISEASICRQSRSPEIRDAAAEIIRIARGWLTPQQEPK